VGEIGLADYERDLVPSLKDVPEIGWVLASHKHGRSFATEAVRASVAWGDVHFVPPKTACIMDSANLTSIRGRREGRIPGIPAHDIQGASHNDVSS
jgi:RimJ/RimL family protein N-acetyltransferase